MKGIILNGIIKGGVYALFTLYFVSYIIINTIFNIYEEMEK